MAHFNEYLNFLELSPLIKHFLQNGKKRLYKKGEFFCQASEVCHNIAYISQGGFRYFYLDTEEDKHIIGYSFEKDFVVDYESFTKQTPAIVYTEAIKASTVYQLSYNQLEAFWAASQQNQLLGRKIAENLFCMTYHRLLSLYPNTLSRIIEKMSRHRSPDKSEGNRFFLEYLSIYLKPHPTGNNFRIKRLISCFKARNCNFNIFIFVKILQTAIFVNTYYLIL